MSEGGETPIKALTDEVIDADDVLVENPAVLVLKWMPFDP